MSPPAMRARLAWLSGGLSLALAACTPPSPGGYRDPPDADRDGHLADADCDDHDPNLWRPLVVYADRDHDDVGAGAPSTLCAHAPPPAGWSEATGDCDDTRSDRWRGVSGYLDVDEDGRGVGGLTTFCRGDDLRGIAGTGGDCAPDDRLAWQELAYAFRDADLDGLFVEEVGFACGGLGLPRGYALVDAVTGDCDDGDPLRSLWLRGWPDADEDGVGDGDPRDHCTGGALPARWAASPGDCAPDDGGRFQLLPYTYADLDHDGVLAPHEGEVCSGASRPAGYALWAPAVDCDDDDALRSATWLAYPDTDLDGFGDGAREPLCIGDVRPEGWAEVAGDCAPADDERWRELPYAYRDADRDTYTVAAAQAATVCSGDALPSGYSNVRSGDDCDDGDPDVFASFTGWPDADADTFGAGAAQAFCTAGALPDGFVANGTDCAADDRDRWRKLAYAGVDADGDTWTLGPAGSLCAGVALPPPYVETARGNDCDDANPLLWRWVVLYQDGDGDGVGAPPRSIPCLGEALPAGSSLLGFDPDDGASEVTADADELEALLLDLL